MKPLRRGGRSSFRPDQPTREITWPEDKEFAATRVLSQNKVLASVILATAILAALAYSLMTSKNINTRICSAFRPAQKWSSTIY